MQAEKVLYGRVAMFRIACPGCGQMALVIDGRTLCCDMAVERPDTIRARREVEGESWRHTFPSAIRKAVLERQAYRCIYCNSDLSRTAHTWNWKKNRWIRCQTNFDHFIPWVYSRDSGPTNVVAACEVCNRIKSSKVFDNINEARRYVLEKRVDHGYSNENVEP